MPNSIKEIPVRFCAWWAGYWNAVTSAFRGMSKDNLTMIASGMVYSTLIAIVPCLTFLFAFLSAFGVLQPFMNIIGFVLHDTFGDQTGDELIAYIQQFSSNAMSLGVVGLVSFIITGILLVDKIYIATNNIFHTKPSTGTMRRFTTFLTFLIVGAFLIVVSFALQSMLQNTLSRIAIGTERPKGVLSIFMPYIVIWLFLFLLYKAVPSAKIRFGAASVGAFTGVISLSIASRIFSIITKWMVSYSVIYGSMASILIALLFLFVCWFIILFSAEIVYVYQFRPDKTLLLGSRQAPIAQMTEAVNMLLLIADKYQKGEGAMTMKELMRRLGIPSAAIISYISDFEDAKMVIAVNTTRTAFIPARPLDQIKLRDIICVLFGGGNTSAADIETIGEAVAVDFLRKGTADLDSVTVENLLERI